MLFIFYFIRQLHDYIYSLKWVTNPALETHSLSMTFLQTLLSRHTTIQNYNGMSFMKRSQNVFWHMPLVNSIIFVSFLAECHPFLYVLQYIYEKIDVYKCFKYALPIHNCLMAFKFVLSAFNSDPDPNPRAFILIIKFQVNTLPDAVSFVRFAVYACMTVGRYWPYKDDKTLCYLECKDMWPCFYLAAAVSCVFHLLDVHYIKANNCWTHFLVPEGQKIYDVKCLYV